MLHDLDSSLKSDPAGQVPANLVGIAYPARIDESPLYEYMYSLVFINQMLQDTPSPQQGELRLSGPPSGQGAGSGARTRDRRDPADLRADSQATVLPTPPEKYEGPNGER
ncbi:hypothetical protein PoB_001134300 [Plakobranchus ocellatus]|uniref:Uncharacterized protein n=1 Tax=Plakobranchus ocellatus TaxID=259542 RepID=A0AAV3YR63_9GAST|nr:hypothetical protein PoB_001134300 [Plakobranchus ocellatus]